LFARDKAIVACYHRVGK